MPKLGTIFTKKLLKMLATSSSSFISAPFSLKTISSADFILLEKISLTVAQNLIFYYYIHCLNRDFHNSFF